MGLAGFYPPIKASHVGPAILSGGLFAGRYMRTEAFAACLDWLLAEGCE